VHEPATAHRNPDVRHVSRVDPEEHEVSRLEPVRVHIATDSELLGDAPRHRDAMPCEDVLHETAAIESGRIGARRAVGSALKCQRVASDRVARDRSRGDLGTFSGNRERPRHRARAGATGQQPAEQGERSKAAEPRRAGQLVTGACRLIAHG